ncbi:hypothetical protein BX666DRAFT_1833305, partial [Dichotomocladium elegans]
PTKVQVQKQRNLRKALHALSAPSTSLNGFSYIYYGCKNRTERKDQRKNLKALGAQNSRILDIHYPSRTVVALLVHNDYREELITQLQKRNVNPLDQYSPTAASALTDPQYKDLSEQEKINIATAKHQQRLVRALPFIRTTISRAVGRLFLEQQWITNSQFE